MKKVWLIFFLFCFAMTTVAQDSQIKAGFILVKAKQASFKNTDAIEKIFIESSSKYKTRKTLLKPGIIPYFDYKTELWVQKPDGIKLKTLTDYSQGSFELTERVAFEQKVGLSIKLKNPGADDFIPIYLQEPGDPKRNEEIRLNKVKYETFCLSFPIYLFPSQDLTFEYLGVAKSGEQKADVLSTSIAETYQIKLFFDQQTHQLLLMSAKFTDPKTEEEIEHKYFFSDYREKNGINFAHKIIIHENGEIVEEREIKRIEINPKLKANFFNVPKAEQPPMPPNLKKNN
jgi:hypothetical protein